MVTSLHIGGLATLPGPHPESGLRSLHVGTPHSFLGRAGSGPSSIVPSLPGNSQILATIPVGTHPATELYDPADGNVYVANEDSSTVTVLHGVSIVGTVPVGSIPFAMALNSSNGRVYVVNYASNNVSVISGAAVIGTVRVGTSPYAIAYDSDSGSMYVANSRSDNVSVISGLNVTGTVAVGVLPQAVAYYHYGLKVFVANSGSDSVSVISGMSVVATTPVGHDPIVLLSDPATFFPTVYVANYASDNVSEMIGSTVVGSVNVTDGPTALAYNSTDGAVYVGKLAAANVTVIQGSTAIANITGSGGGGSLAYDSANGFLYSVAYGYSILEMAGEVGVGGVFIPNGVGFIDPVVVDTATGDIYVGLNGFGEVDVIDPIWVASFTAMPASIPAGGNTTFATVVRGQTGPINYSYVELPPDCRSRNVSVLSCASSVVGVYTTNVKVTDSAGHAASLGVTLTVTAPPNTSSTFLGLPGLWGYLLLLGIAVTVGGLGYWLSRRRRSSRPEPSSPPPRGSPSDLPAGPPGSR